MFWLRSQQPTKLVQRPTQEGKKRKGSWPDHDFSKPRFVIRVTSDKPSLIVARDFLRKLDTVYMRNIVV
jgi:hypothetical protein